MRKIKLPSQYDHCAQNKLILKRNEKEEAIMKTRRIMSIKTGTISSSRLSARWKVKISWINATTN